MKLQDKLQSCIDENVIGVNKASLKAHHDFEPSIHRAMIAFAAYCCERQRESDAKVANTIIDDTDNDLNPCAPYLRIDRRSILNNKLITDELTEKVY